MLYEVLRRVIFIRVLGLFLLSSCIDIDVLMQFFFVQNTKLFKIQPPCVCKFFKNTGFDHSICISKIRPVKLGSIEKFVEDSFWHILSMVLIDGHSTITKNTINKKFGWSDQLISINKKILIISLNSTNTKRFCFVVWRVTNKLKCIKSRGAYVIYCKSKG